MVYLENFIKETLRTFSPVPNPIPRVALEDHYIGKYLIKKGDFVDINLHGNCNNPEFFPNPEKF